MLRATLVLAGAVAVVVAGGRATQDAVANGDTRTITIRHMHLKEDTTVTFKRDGRYDSAALEKLNWAMRDWRSDEPIRMDPRLFDLAWEVQRRVGSTQPFHVVSAYRSPNTNAMLRRRSRGVAKHSQHTLGKAMDFYLPDTSSARIREVAMRMQGGGVGFYPRAHTPFIHLDAGSVRSWPRMTRDQLVRLFPDRKTVHLPADGKPLEGYELARAEITSRGVAVAGYAASDLDEGAIIASGGGRSFWAALFGGDEEEADARPTRGRRAAPRQQPAVLAYANPRALDDSSASDGGRFATVRQAMPAAPAPTPAAPRRAPQPAQEPVQVAAVAPAAMPAAPPEARPQFLDAPLPLARPRGLSVPEAPGDVGPTQVAALAQSGGPLAVAPQPVAIAALPPRRPDGMTALVETVVAGQPVSAPVPPMRPAGMFELAALDMRGVEPRAAEGRLVSVDHPQPPGRPGSRPPRPASPPTAEPVARVARTPIAAQYDADRAGLDSLFAAVSPTSAPPAAAGVTIARSRAAAPARAVIQAPSPAAALGFRHVEPGDAGIGAFRGPAVRPLPTTFTQN